MITDEMVKKAREAWPDQVGVGVTFTDAMRAALEAVAPALVAQGMLEAAQSACLDCGAAQTIEARAQKLDPMLPDMVPVKTGLPQDYTGIKDSIRPMKRPRHRSLIRNDPA
jgi:hypothetical protein